MKALLFLAAMGLAMAVPQDVNQEKKTASTATTTGTSAPAEAKTQTFKGTLMDASCAMPGTVSSSSTSSSTSTASAETQKSSTSTTAERKTTTEQSSTTQAQTAGDASRTAASGQACAVSTSTTEFAMKLDDGRMVRFDSVGNMRTQEAIKNKKKWNEAASAGKTIHAKASGMMSGDKLVVMSIN